MKLIKEKDYWKMKIEEWKQDKYKNNIPIKYFDYIAKLKGFKNYQEYIKTFKL
jgi:hypothetical protein